MILPGHFASVLLASHLVKVNRRAALAASLFPDVMDKGLHWVAKLTPSDRLWAHTAWAVAGTSALAWLVGRAAGWPGIGRSWLMGYIVHLLGDLSAPLALFYPLSRRGFHGGARFREIIGGRRAIPWRVFAAEALLVLAAVLAERRRVRRDGQQGQGACEP
jgi:hypothetical protein